jgi:hypothetical protein
MEQAHHYPAQHAMKKRPPHPARLALRIMEAGFALVFLGAVTHHVITQDFKPLAAFCVPILVVFYGFASLLFVRGRALAKGPWQVRSLYAGERALQATLWYLCGIILGTTVYGLARYLDIPFQAEERWLVALWLLLFLVPAALMQMGLLCFMRALWVIAPQLLRKVDAFEVMRRVHER